MFYQIIYDNYDEINNNNNILSIAQIFNLIETNKDNLNIETYSLSQTTLEQVFLSFARKQIDTNSPTGPNTVLVNKRISFSNVKNNQTVAIDLKEL